MVIFIPCWGDDWVQSGFYTLVYVESWHFQPAHCMFRTDWKYGNGKNWWMEIGRTTRTLYEESPGTYSFTWQYLKSFENSLEREISQWCFSEITK